LCKQLQSYRVHPLKLRRVSLEPIRNRSRLACCFIHLFIFYLFNTWRKTMTSPEEKKTPVLLSNRYQVLSVLGDGGFGKTFLVEDTQMPSNRRCVLKQLKPVHDNPQTNQMVKDRFQREAAILEKLGEEHDQIPRLYAYFSEADQFYLVEEWVEGDTLSQRIQKEGPQDEKTVQIIISELLSAIAHVHSAGIVHRDIKPDNIILRARDGKPVLIDFGAVKETMNTVIDSHANSSHSIVVGTPGYMPAEQMSGRPVFASDIYSVGMTAIYMLTGKIPQELDINPQTGELLWRQYAPQVSTEFGNFLDCAIHMNAQSRFRVVQEMLSILNNLILNSMPAPAPAFPETRQSAQTIISGPAAAEGPTEYSSAAVAPIVPVYSYQNPDSANTQVVSPAMAVGPSSVQQAAVGAQGQWKNAVIVGGMVGFSVLLGALVLIERLPGVMGGSAKEETAKVTPADADKQADAKGDVPAKTPEPKPSAASEAVPVAVPEPPQPVSQVASTPGANSTIVGEAGNTNIRAGAGTVYDVVDVVQVGDRVKVINRSSDSGGNPWYQVVVPSGQTGWVAGQLIQVDGDAAPPSLPSNSQSGTDVGNDGGNVKPDNPDQLAANTDATITGQPGSKNIRSGPGTSYGTAHEAYPGDRVVIRDTALDAGGYLWYKIYFPQSGAEGWIAEQLIAPDDL
jgi:serine/threonine protein kinase, bacterial